MRDEWIAGESNDAETMVVATASVAREEKIGIVQKSGSGSEQGKGSECVKERKERGRQRQLITFPSWERSFLCLPEHMCDSRGIGLGERPLRGSTECDRLCSSPFDLFRWTCISSRTRSGNLPGNVRETDTQN